MNLMNKTIKQNRRNVIEQNVLKHTKTFYKRDIYMKSSWNRKTKTNETKKLSNEIECNLITS
jgi:hypothetical protein